jgi:hypothetical protein
MLSDRTSSGNYDEDPFDTIRDTHTFADGLRRSFEHIGEALHGLFQAELK